MTMSGKLPFKAINAHQFEVAVLCFTVAHTLSFLTSPTGY